MWLKLKRLKERAAFLISLKTLDKHINTQL